MEWLNSNIKEKFLKTVCKPSAKVQFPKAFRLVQVAAIKLKMSKYFPKTIKFFSLEILDVAIVEFSVKGIK